MIENKKEFDFDLTKNVGVVLSEVTDLEVEKVLGEFQSYISDIIFHVEEKGGTFHVGYLGSDGRVAFVKSSNEIAVTSRVFRQCIQKLI